MDVNVSCKHIFHPFCIGVMLKDSNKCCVCNVKLHPDWWTSWGIRELVEDPVELAKKMDLEQTWEEIMKKTKKAVTFGLDLKFEGMVF